VTTALTEVAPSGSASSPSGTGTSAGLDGFFAPAFTAPSFCHFSEQNYSITGGVLTVFYPAGSTAPSAGAPYGGAQDCLPGASGPKTSATLSYRVRFPVGFQWVKGGKLPGLYGGDEPFSGGAHTSNGWSLRLMWRSGGAAEIYGYTANTSGYGDDYQGGTFLADGQWHTVSEHVQLNTSGVANGVATLAIDGAQVVTVNNLDITNTATPIGGLFFSTFYGGHDATWAPTAAMHVDFSAFTIGP
jgi:hypothetical protein